MMKPLSPDALTRLHALPPTDVAAITAFLEARDQPVLGLVAVLFTIANRALAHRTSWTDEALKPLQYSCWNGGPSQTLGLTLAETLLHHELPEREDAIILQAAQFLAETIHSGQVADPVAGARHYCRRDLRPLPEWTLPPARIVRRIGDHLFWTHVA